MKKIKVPFELTTEQLQKLHEEHCIYVDDYRQKGFVREWEDCEECILRKIPWIVGNGELLVHPINGIIERDLCFAIWHEGVLDDLET